MIHRRSFSWLLFLLILFIITAITPGARSDNVPFKPQVNFTLPTRGSSFKPLDKINIAWKSATEEALKERIVIIDLICGAPGKQALMGPLCWTYLNASTKNCILPPFLLSGSLYSVRIAPNSFSELFSITSSNQSSDLSTGNACAVRLPQLTNIPVVLPPSPPVSSYFRNTPFLGITGILLLLRVL